MRWSMTGTASPSSPRQTTATKCAPPPPAMPCHCHAVWRAATLLQTWAVVVSGTRDLWILLCGSRLPDMGALAPGALHGAQLC